MGIVDTIYTIPLFIAAITGLVTISNREVERFRQAASAHASNWSAQTITAEERRVARWPNPTRDRLAIEQQLDTRSQTTLPNREQSRRIDLSDPPFLPTGRFAWERRSHLPGVAVQELLRSPRGNVEQENGRTFAREHFLERENRTVSNVLASLELRATAAQIGLCVAEYCARYPSQLCPLAGLAGAALRRALSGNGGATSSCPTTERTITTVRQQTLQWLKAEGKRHSLMEQRLELELLGEARATLLDIAKRVD
jgi:hypothetical protein